MATIVKDINVQMLKELVERAGGSTVVAYEADVGQSTLEKMMADSYPSRPRKKLRGKLSKYFNIPEAGLFPFVGSNGRSRAS